MTRSVLLLITSVGLVTDASAERVFHFFPRASGVGKRLRAEIGAVVRAHVSAAGHVLGGRRGAAWLLATRVRSEAGRFVVNVRYRRATDKEAKEAIAMASREAVLATVGDLLNQVLPRPSAAALPADLPGPLANPDAPGVTDSVSIVKTDDGRKALSTWVEDQPRWLDVYAPPIRLAPFPRAVDPPPLIGELPR